MGMGSNESGQVGDGSKTTRPTPVAVVGIQNVASVSAGGYHSLAIKTDRTVWAWGENGNGQLGNGTNAESLAPVQSIGLTNALSVSAGNRCSLAVKSGGSLWVWGQNNYGQLGDGTIADRNTPWQHTGITNVIMANLGEAHGMALKSAVVSFTSADVIRALSISAGTKTATADEKTRMDLNGSGKVDIPDTARMARKVAGLEANP